MGVGSEQGGVSALASQMGARTGKIEQCVVGWDADLLRHSLRGPQPCPLLLRQQQSPSNLHSTKTKGADNTSRFRKISEMGGRVLESKELGRSHCIT